MRVRLTGPLRGRLADRFGTLRVFAGAALISDGGGGHLGGYGGVGMLAAATTLAAVLVAWRVRSSTEMGASAPILGTPPRLGEVLP